MPIPADENTFPYKPRRGKDDPYDWYGSFSVFMTEDDWADESADEEKSDADSR